MSTGEERGKRQVSLWHEGFYQCVSDRAPPGFEVRSEVPLSLRPRRADLLLLRRRDEPRRDDRARILRGLWPRLPQATVVELKSPTRGARRSELLRLFGYGVQYQELHWRDLSHRNELALVLVLASPNQALADDLASVDCQLRPLGNGYAELVGFLYTCFVVFTDEVSEAEQDDFLRIFSHHAVQTREAYHWLEHWIVEKQIMPNVKQREGYDEMLEKLVRSLSPQEILRHIKPEERLVGLSPEQRLAGLAPEQRLAGLSQVQQILALADEVLRGFSDDYIRSLPDDVQQVIRKRLAQGK